MTDFDAIIRMDSPIGRLELRAFKGKVVGVEIARGGRLHNDGVPDSPSPVLDKARKQLEEYFAGTRKRFQIPVSLVGTAFQQSVWGAVNDIPFGKVLSYGEVGHETGRPTAGRAVGGAVGANPVPIIIPCHRVLASDGRITGYSGGNGIETKAWLLDHEGITHR
ncbi:MAG: methylated-DNA--[protein]-cysteine S-methyltransferase [Microbacteriaceae bacterium]